MHPSKGGLTIRKSPVVWSMLSEELQRAAFDMHNIKSPLRSFGVGKHSPLWSLAHAMKYGTMTANMSRFSIPQIYAAWLIIHNKADRITLPYLVRIELLYKILGLNEEGRRRFNEWLQVGIDRDQRTDDEALPTGVPNIFIFMQPNILMADDQYTICRVHSATDGYDESISVRGPNTHEHVESFFRSAIFNIFQANTPVRPADYDRFVEENLEKYVIGLFRTSYPYYVDMAWLGGEMYQMDDVVLCLFKYYPRAVDSFHKERFGSAASFEGIDIGMTRCVYVLSAFSPANVLPDERYGVKVFEDHSRSVSVIQSTNKFTGYTRLKVRFVEEEAAEPDGSEESETSEDSETGSEGTNESHKRARIEV